MTEAERLRDYRARKKAEVEALRAVANGSHVRNTQMLPMCDIRVHAGVQLRAQMREEVVAEYVEAMQEGAEFPPVVVFGDGETYWLSDGFHRHMACQTLEFREIECEVRDGGRREALLHAAGANAAHGLRRSNADKRRAVAAVLGDEEWQRWSDVRIAEVCGVSDMFVGSVRRSGSNRLTLEATTANGPRQRQGRDGNYYTVPQRREPAAPPPMPASTPEQDEARRERQRLWCIGSNLQEGMMLLDHHNVAVEEAARTFLEADPAMLPPGADLTAAKARRVAAVMLRYAELKEERDNG